MNRACAAGEFIEVDGAKLKCVYWITQHKDGGKGKNRDTLKTFGMGHGARGKRRGEWVTRRRGGFSWQIAAGSRQQPF